MVGHVAFLMKNVVLLAASIYLLRQDALRVFMSEAAGLASVRADIEASNRMEI
jgi:hypothetical protein